jgi:pSer/pThr/pTyr-binding forkhead associated (FHA) protein
MPFINLRDKRIRLPAGQLRIGRGRDVEIVLPPPSVPSGTAVGAAGQSGEAVEVETGGRQGQFALLVVDASGAATVSKLTEDAAVYLNSVPAGLEPTPLLHGDRLEVDGIELRFSDERQGGNTAEFPIVAADEPQARVTLPNGTGLGDGTPGAANRVPTGQSARVGAPVRNGRLVSLLDGREYAVGEDGLSIGRDAACDVVVPANSVSRRHARIALEVRGYTITDSSTNGIVVSGERIRTSRLLRRGDVIKVGPEEFRFYEEEVESDPTPPAPRAAMPTPPSPPPRPRAPVLATLVVANQGVQRGRVFEVTSPLTHIGRGAHNDVALDDDAVSESHAKLQLRDHRWYIVDLGSTNGTYANGERLTGEHQLQGEVELRFGGAKLLFKPARGAKTPSAGTRVVAAFKSRTPTPGSVAAVDESAANPAAGLDAGPDESQRSLVIVWLVLLGVVVLTVSVIIRALT